MDELLAQFLIEARELVTSATDDLAALQQDPRDRQRLDSAFRAVHTLKGSVALFDMAPAGKILHAAEDLLDHVRKGAIPLDEPKRSTIVACIDRVDAWVDAMEAAQCLPGNAAAEADQLLARLGGKTPETPGLPSGPPGLTAFRYTPDSDCFFRGDDPLALVATIPSLTALKIIPRDPWPALDLLEPFRCNIIIEGQTEASADDVRAIFRLVRDQVAIATVPSPVIAEPEERAARTLRIAEERIDALVDGVSDLVVAGNALIPLIAEATRLDPSLGARFRQVQGGLERGIGQMHRSVSAIRMMPVGPAIRRLPRIVRELAETLGRQVDFVVEGQQTEADKAITDAVYEPLLHLVRNALGHGIEDSETRRAAGKPDRGQLRLTFRRSGEQLLIELADDGAGIDPDRLRARAIERNLLSEDAARALTDEAAQALIFAPGFSTAERVSDVSGRGVGMDAVRAVLDRLGGRIEVESRVGQGATMRLGLPLTAITTRMLIVHAGGDRYAVPFERVAETAVVPSDRLHPVGDREALVLRDRTIPVLHLSEFLGGHRTPSPNVKLIVTRAGGERVAFVVDGFGERIEAMIRPTTGLLATLPGISGTTLLGNGDVMLVLDPESLVTGALVA